VVHLRRRVVALVVYAHGARVVEHARGFIAQLGLAEELLHIAQAVAPAVIAFTGDGALAGLLIGFFEKERAASVAAPASTSGAVSFAAGLGGLAAWTRRASLAGGV